MAEIKFSVLSRQRLEQRILYRGMHAEEGWAWEERNASESSIDWRFTSNEAEIKVTHLYPEIVEWPSNDPNLQ